MRVDRWGIGVFLVFVTVCSVAQTGKQIAVTGTLTRAMAIGAETSGWAIQFDSEKTIGGKPLNSIEIVYANSERLEKLKDKRVRATGKLGTQTGVETGERTVLNVSSIRASESVTHVESAPATLNLTGTEWRLEELAGGKVLDDPQATLMFPEAGKVAGKGSCNRFTGAAEISGKSIRFGPLASTRMACAEPAMKQETQYLAALQAAERYEWKSPNLLIYYKGSEKPLRFVKVEKSAK